MEIEDGTRLVEWRGDGGNAQENKIKLDAHTDFSLDSAGTNRFMEAEESENNMCLTITNPELKRRESQESEIEGEFITK